MSGRSCLIEGCIRPHKGLGYCHTHLACFKRTGDPIPHKVMPLVVFEDNTAICQSCDKRKSLTQFKSSPRSKHGVVHDCNQCLYRRYQQKRTGNRYQWINAYKLERGCMDCGYAQHAVALDFDHRPGEVKCFTIGGKDGINKATWEAILLEIAKCDVVCANCHRVRTHERRREVMPNGWK